MPENMYNDEKEKLLSDAQLEGIPLQEFVSPSFSMAQMTEVYLGLKAGLNVHLFANPLFSVKSMQEIRKHETIRKMRERFATAV